MENEENEPKIQKRAPINYLEAINSHLSESKRIADISKLENPTLEEILYGFASPVAFSNALIYDLSTRKVEYVYSIINPVYVNKHMGGDLTPSKEVNPIKLSDLSTGATLLDPINGSKLRAESIASGNYVVGAKIKMESRLNEEVAVKFVTDRGREVKASKIIKCVYKNNLNGETIDSTFIVGEEGTTLLKQMYNDFLTASSDLDSMLSGTAIGNSPVSGIYILDAGRKTRKLVDSKIYLNIFDDLTKNMISKNLELKVTGTEIYFNGKPVKLSDFMLDQSEEELMAGQQTLMALFQVSNIKDGKISYPSIKKGKTKYFTENIGAFMENIKGLFEGNEKVFDDLVLQLKSIKSDADPSVS